MTHLGESFVTIDGKRVNVKFGMLFWKLILAHYKKEFSQIAELFKEQIASPFFMLDVLLFGHKAYCELEKVEQVYPDDQLVELANDGLTEEEWTAVMECLMDSKMLGKSLIPSDEKKRKKVA